MKSSIEIKFNLVKHFFCVKISNISLAANQTVIVRLRIVISQNLDHLFYYQIEIHQSIIMSFKQSRPSAFYAHYNNHNSTSDTRSVNIYR